MARRRAYLSIVTVALAGILVRGVASCAEGEPRSALPPADSGVSPDTASVLPSAEGCPPDAWCPVDLPPDPVSLNGIWGSAPDDVWIVGTPDVTYHWNGTRLALARVDTRQSLFGVWGSAKDDVWTFSTSSTMWHTRGFEGEDAGWTRSSGATAPNEAGWPTPIFAMWGRSATDIWAVGAGSGGQPVRPSVFHCDGWRGGEPMWRASPTSASDPPEIEPFSLHAIGGSAEAGVWIVGAGGKTRRTNGWQGDRAVWVPINSHTSTNLYAVWASPNGDVWAAGEGGTMRRFTRDDAGDYSAAAVEMPTSATIRALWGSADDDVWAVGGAGAIVHWDGTAWTLVDTPHIADLGAHDLFAIWGVAGSDLWIAGEGVLAHKGSAPVPERSR